MWSGSSTQTLAAPAESCQRIYHFGYNAWRPRRPLTPAADCGTGIVVADVAASIASVIWRRISARGAVCLVYRYAAHLNAPVRGRQALEGPMYESSDASPGLPVQTGQ